MVRPAGLEPAQPSRTTSTSGWRVYHSATNASRHPGSNRAVPRTKREPQAVRGGRAAPHGLEPRLTASEAAVLPLDERASSRRGETRTRSRRLFEDGRSALAYAPVRRRGIEPRSAG